MTGTDGLAVLGRVILLLQAAADHCLSPLATDPVPGLEESLALSDVGLAGRLVASQACALLPADIEPADVPPAASSPDDGEPLEVLRAAEALTRTVPIEVLRAAEALTRTVPIEAPPAGSSRVVVALCDLLREHG
ncbi:hypothetical protein [Humibacillus xanthopallidus]|uniref:Uncharacterized protein n=1 Tax=Humibacillus xanthopallidus TaxID=412689 RepID=A0A543HZP3_9MICO|nr:hypothetical protein [Humibacillus xanthopallidus]TQM63750.1 hypothetical protein FBY41_0096 [Humibacillus xanthopallidus]